MSYHQNSGDIDPIISGHDETGNSSGGPAPSSVPETSPSTQSSQPQPSSPVSAEEDDDGSRSDVSSDLAARQLAVEGHEEHLREQVRVELDAQDRESAWRRRLQTPIPQPQQTPSQPPPLIIGAPLGKNLTAIEAATRLVSQWEAIHESALQSTPEAASPILEELTQARDQLAAVMAQQQQASSLSASTLGGETQNPVVTPLNSLDAHKAAAIASRIELLTDSLEDSHFPPERANIAAAVSLYRAARIPYSANWALLYAGHLVDFAPTYASFTADRADRLDRYARLHGEGWLWIEPPLAREPDGPTFFSARRGTFLPEHDTSYDMGHYSVTMSFRRMKNLVYRGAPVADASGKRKHDRLSRGGDDDEGMIKAGGDWPACLSDEDPDAPDDILPEPVPSSALRASRPSRHPRMTRDHAAPTLHFRMLLDSGATLPLIYDRDARALGIRRANYAASSKDCSPGCLMSIAEHPVLRIVLRHSG
ncbi:uncharacterized protein GLRG_05966 [Colletotrichum graminicola M1.001]|uniref:Uncharacterized protein n=1 Tax=Colletotrichum graminicola (strain M1.001 / M2 / FGSC 10212) TaxID=645133 RepID=E3QIY4_COLGM|nr:uncharacterized protein GLRG_05966 [Colletotrichum graminicola M1.001]EFQ30822.1 hypothetical protein GLRG_05966 [Colletotrichum graminicola M1.001]